MVGGVVNGVLRDTDPTADAPRLHIQTLGPLSIVRAGVPVPLPRSRKVRALVAYLVLAPRAVGRSQLCELLWDLPNDPRGELRWSLSKLRSLLDEPERRRVQTRDDRVALDLSDCFVDALEVLRATGDGLDRLAPERLAALAALFAGDFVEGLEIDRSAEFGAWLTAQRCRLRACHAALLEHLVARLPSASDEVFVHLDALLQLAPFDRSAHGMLLQALAARGRIREGDEHVASAALRFEAEGLDPAPLGESWRLARARQGDTPCSSPAQAMWLPAPPDGATPDTRHRASVAVMPFADFTNATAGQIVDGLAHDVITRLAKLRNVFVIAHGTTSVLGARGVAAQEAGRLLNVDYVAGGSLRRAGDRVVVTVELSETRSARVVWAEEFAHRREGAFDMLDEIGDHIVATIASEIEMAERNRAILRPPSNLNAWEAYHRGLWHVYRYQAEHNRMAEHFFEMAVRLDPGWARALSALSFAHFQNAFQRWAEREHEVDLAFRAAEQSLVADERDPSAHWAMGRALWLRGRHAQSLAELEKAVELSPSFAHGHYTLAFVHAQSGDAHFGIGCADHSRQLSPFDPLLCAMLTTRAIALVRLGRFDEAADWAVRAVARPNAFAHLQAIAAACLGLAGRCDEGQQMVTTLRRALPDYRLDDLLTTFQFAPDAAELLRKGARLGTLV